MPMACPTMDDSARTASRDAARTKAVLQAPRHAEHAAETSDVLSDEDDRFVAVHQLVQGTVERLGKAAR